MGSSATTRKRERDAQLVQVALPDGHDDGVVLQEAARASQRAN